MLKDKIPFEQFGLIQVDPWTGVLLDEDGKWAIGDKAGLILAPDFDSASRIAAQRVAENPFSEWWVMDHLGETMARFRNEEAISKEVAKRMQTK